MSSPSAFLECNYQAEAPIAFCEHKEESYILKMVKQKLGAGVPHASPGGLSSVISIYVREKPSIVSASTVRVLLNATIPHFSQNFVYSVT